MSTRQKLAQVRGLILDEHFNRADMIKALVEGLPPEILGFSRAVKDDSREQIFELIRELWLDYDHYDVNIDEIIGSLQRHRAEAEDPDGDDSGDEEEKAQRPMENPEGGGRRRRTKKRRRRKRRRRRKTNRRKTKRRRKKRSRRR